MSLEEFHLLPYELGWKHEYFKGVAHFTPRMAVAYTSIPAQPRGIQAPILQRHVQENDEPELARCFEEAFTDAFEYCDQTPKEVRESAKQCLRHFFKGPFHRWLPASRVALAPSTDSKPGSIIGAALILSQSKEKDWALLDMLFVAPRQQRHSIATALVSSALAELHESGWRTLVSRYQLGNGPSQAWHKRFGFVDEPDLAIAQLRLNAAEHELGRRTQIGSLNAAEKSALELERDHWGHEVQRLQQALMQGKPAEAFAWRRFSPQAEPEFAPKSRSRS